MSRFQLKALGLPLFAAMALGCQAGIDGGFTGDDYDDALGIVANKIDQGHPAVAALFDGGGSFCTGVLVGPRAVLTAAHCIEDRAPSEFKVFFGTKVKGGAGIRATVSQISVHPDFDPLTLENDLGVAILAQPVDIAPMPYDLDVTSEDVGRTISYVSFEPTALAGGAGRKTIAQVSLEEVNDSSLMYLWKGHESDLPPAIPEFQPGDCLLGAGSPALMVQDGVEYVIGINSFSSADCRTFGVNRKTFSQLGYIDPTSDI